MNEGITVNRFLHSTKRVLARNVTPPAALLQRLYSGEGQRQPQQQQQQQRVVQEADGETGHGVGGALAMALALPFASVELLECRRGPQGVVEGDGEDETPGTLIYASPYEGEAGSVNPEWALPPDIGDQAKALLPEEVTKDYVLYIRIKVKPARAAAGGGGGSMRPQARPAADTAAAAALSAISLSAPPAGTTGTTGTAGTAGGTGAGAGAGVVVRAGALGSAQELPVPASTTARAVAEDAPPVVVLEHRIDLRKWVIAPGVTEEALGQLPLNSIMFIRSDGLFIPHQLYITLRMRGVISSAPSQSVDKSAADVSEHEQLLSEVHEQEAEVQALKERAIAVVLDGTSSREAFEQGRVAMEAAELRRQLQVEEAALREEEAKLHDELAELADLNEQVRSMTTSHEELLESINDLRVHSKGEKDTLLRMEFLLEARQTKLVSELRTIYPIERSPETREWTIRGLPLPADLTTRDDEVISSALGYAVHTVMMLSKYLQVPLRYQMSYFASRSTISDTVIPGGPLPLFRSRDPRSFERAITYLNRNIDQLLLIRGVAYERNLTMLQKLDKIFRHELSAKL